METLNSEDNSLHKTIENSPHHQFNKLNATEKLLIKFVYFKKWRQFLKRSKLPKSQKNHFEVYFKEIHAQYYTSVVRGARFVTTSRLIRNFLLSKVNENMRLVLQSYNPLNLTSYIQGLRSQIELNALLNKFIKDEEYLKKYILLNDDRSKVKEVETVLNVNTLVKSIDSDLIKYSDHYNKLSLLLHPNPSAIAFYAQAEKTIELEKTNVLSPRIKHYFDETIATTKSSTEWFYSHTWLFLTFIEHFLILYIELLNHFFVNPQEKEQFEVFAMAEIIGTHQKQILKSINDAVRDGRDINEELKETFDAILHKHHQ
jgi:hypothetical protein